MIGLVNGISEMEFGSRGANFELIPTDDFILPPTQAFCIYIVQKRKGYPTNNLDFVSP